MAAADTAPKAAARGSSGSKSSGGGGGGKLGPRSEKGVLVAAAEVVGRPLAVWSQKLLDWPKAVVAAYRAETSEHLIRFQEPPADQQPREQWVRLGSTRFQWLREQPESAAPNPTYAGSPHDDDCVGRRIKVFWPGMGRWYQGKVRWGVFFFCGWGGVRASGGEKGVGDESKEERCWRVAVAAVL